MEELRNAPRRGELNARSIVRLFYKLGLDYATQRFEQSCHSGFVDSLAGNGNCYK